MAEGHAWRGGVACRRDDHLSGRYASYWNAFLFRHAIYLNKKFALLHSLSCGEYAVILFVLGTKTITRMIGHAHLFTLEIGHLTFN